MVRPLTEQRVYFPGLDALRFVAALSVLVQHVAQFQFLFGFGDPGWFHRLFLTGRDGVLLFFVLSGFLITYLLLVERDRDGRIDIRRFYVRRALRIWPLYFLLVAVAFVIYVAFGPVPGWTQPENGSLFCLYLVFLANVALFHTPPLGISHTWSIAVEEQFYAVWPPLLRVFGGSLLAFTVAFVAVKVALVAVLFATLGTSSPIAIFTQQLALESMAIGAAGAVLVYRRSAVLRLLFHPLAQLATAAAFVIVVVDFDGLFERTPSVATTLLSLVFVMVILNVGANDRSLLRLRVPALDYLGRISYGIYMFHPLVIYGLFLAIYELGWSVGTPLLALVYAAAIAVTIGLAAVSYRFYETPFLRLKKRFAHVESGGDTLPVSGFAGPAGAVAASR